MRRFEIWEDALGSDRSVLKDTAGGVLMASPGETRRALADLVRQAAAGGEPPAEDQWVRSGTLIGPGRQCEVDLVRGDTWITIKADAREIEQIVAEVLLRLNIG